MFFNMFPLPYFHWQTHFSIHLSEFSMVIFSQIFEGNVICQAFPMELVLLHVTKAKHLHEIGSFQYCEEGMKASQIP